MNLRIPSSHSDVANGIRNWGTMRNAYASMTPSLILLSKTPPCPKKKAAKRPTLKQSTPTSCTGAGLILMLAAISGLKIPKDVSETKLVVMTMPAATATTHL